MPYSLLYSSSSSPFLHTNRMSVDSVISNSSLDSAEGRCANNTAATFIGVSFIATRFFLLFPASIFIFYLGFQKWQQQKNSISAVGHSDIFTYHQCVMELMWLLGTSLHALLTYVGFLPMTTPGFYLATPLFIGETSFHVLTCLDRYLAVVHPVTYRDLRNTRGVTFRNIAIVCVWLLCSLMICAVNILTSQIFLVILLSFLVLSLMVISFCSFCVLLALISPGPGDGSGEKKHVDQTKRRACFTVTAIMGVLCLWFLGFLVFTSLIGSRVIINSVICLLEISLLWFSFPSSLILPLLYLYKTVKVPCGRRNNA